MTDTPIKRVSRKEARCRICRCSQNDACNPPCEWEFGEENLCSSCAYAVRVLKRWLESAHMPNLTALLREVKPKKTEGVAQEAGAA